MIFVLFRQKKVLHLKFLCASCFHNSLLIIKHKDIVPETRASKKQQQGQTLYLYSLNLAHAIKQTGPRVMVCLGDFST